MQIMLNHAECDNDDYIYIVAVLLFVVLNSLRQCMSLLLYYYSVTYLSLEMLNRIATSSKSYL